MNKWINNHKNLSWIASILPLSSFSTRPVIKMSCWVQTSSQWNQLFADNVQPSSPSCPLAVSSLCLSLSLLLPGRRRGTEICGRGDHQSPAGTQQPEPSCSPPLSCCSGTAESSGCTWNSDRFTHEDRETNTFRETNTLVITISA